MQLTRDSGRTAGLMVFCLASVSLGLGCSSDP